MIRTASTGMNRLVAQVCEREIGLHKGSAASKGTLCRQNFTKESEDAINAHLAKLGSALNLRGCPGKAVAYSDKAPLSLQLT